MVRGFSGWLGVREVFSGEYCWDYLFCLFILEWVRLVLVDSIGRSFVMVLGFRIFIIRWIV